MTQSFSNVTLNI